MNWIEKYQLAFEMRYPAPVRGFKIVNAIPVEKVIENFSIEERKWATLVQKELNEKLALLAENEALKKEVEELRELLTDTINFDKLNGTPPADFKL
jgi:hypothetical protein